MSKFTDELPEPLRDRPSGDFEVTTDDDKGEAVVDMSVREEKPDDFQAIETGNEDEVVLELTERLEPDIQDLDAMSMEEYAAWVTASHPETKSSRGKAADQKVAQAVKDARRAEELRKLEAMPMDEYKRLVEERDKER